jgi:hypothetical protein
VALNTVAKVRDEGNWRLEGWSSLIANESEFDTFIQDLLDRANHQIRYRVGASWYAVNSGVDPIDDILKEAEMHLVQAFLLDAAAGITETGSDTNPAPFLGTGEEIRRVADARRLLAEELLLATRAQGSAVRPLKLRRPK